MSWKRLRDACVIGLTALIASACSVSRSASVTSASTDLRITESRIDTVREQVMVAVCDSITETTTITIRENEAGDTIKVVQVTERDRVRDRSAIRDVREKVEVRIDTVYIEHRDSVFVETPRQARGDKARASPVVSALRWVFWIIVAVIGLITVIKVSKVFKFFI